MNPVPLFLIIVSLPLLLGGCGKKTSKPGAKANPPSTSPAQEANNNQPKTDPTPKLEKENAEPPKAEPKVEAKNPEPTKTAATKLIANPIVEKAIRKQIKKPTGELTKVDLEKVTELNFALAGTKITDAVLKEVAKCKQLISLNFNEGQITAEGLKEVAKLQKLETLGLSSTGVTDVGLKEVAKCTQLT